MTLKIQVGDKNIMLDKKGMWRGIYKGGGEISALGEMWRNWCEK